LIRNRKEWNNLVEKARTHPGLKCCRRRRRSVARMVKCGWVMMAQIVGWKRQGIYA
jgi:hypothetical protein